MLSYMLPTEDKPPPENRNGNVPRDAGYRIAEIQSRRDHHHSRMQNSHVNSPRMTHCGSRVVSTPAIPFAATTTTTTTTTMTMTMTRPKVEQFDEIDEIDEFRRQNGNGVVNGCKESTEMFGDSPKHEITTAKKSTLYNSSGRVVKDDSLYSIVSDASTAGSEKKHKLFNGAKHVGLKRVSFGSSKGSMVETLVYETPVQEEPETNHFLEHNGRLPTTMVYGSPPTLPPDTDEGRERVRVSLLESTPCPSTPGVLLLEATTTDHFDEHLRAMATSPAELLTAHTEHTTPTYHTQISTDSGWDNPFRPDGDLSREADEIVELIKGGKPITPTPGQNAPLLPGGDAATPVANSVAAAAAPGDDLDSSVSPLLSSTVVSNQQSSPRQANQGNGNAHGTPIKGSAAAANNQQAVHEKVAPSVNAATVEVGRVTAQGPGDASQVEHVTLKKKPKCKCCVLQ